MRVGGIRSAVRVLKYTTACGVVGSSLWVLHRNHWDVTSVGFLRFGRAAFAGMVIVYDYKHTLAGLDNSSEKYKALISQVHLRSAERLRAMICVNGGCFIKFGQHIGSLDFLLPGEYVSTMRVLHSQAPQTSFHNVRSVVTRELGELETVFADFDRHPVGAASLAQVHRARLHDGTLVAVKVQHPHVREHSFVDMKTLELLVTAAHWIFPAVQLGWFAEESKRMLDIELDFDNEGHNCEKVRHMFAHLKFLKVPKIHWNLTTQSVLTMEYCEGAQVNDLQYMKDNDIPRDEVAMNLGKLYSEMIFVRGYIHCDPHPGNILVNKTSDGTKIILLDHGLYETLSDEFRLDYCHLWLALLRADEPAIERYSARLGAGRLHTVFACMVTARPWKSVVDGMQRVHTLQTLQEEDTFIQQQAGAHLPEITSVLTDIPSAMRLIFKTNDLLRGLDSTLGMRAHTATFMPMSSCCVRAVHADRRARCTSRACVVREHASERLSLCAISLYRTYLWLASGGASLMAAVQSACSALRLQSILTRLVGTWA